ncbi:MAG: HD domain-containing protein [Phycisphaerales bacterium]
MQHPAHNFLSSLQAAACACAVYGDDHASFAQQCGLASRAGLEALTGHSTLTVFFLEERVVANDHALPGRADEFSQLASLCRRHHADSLTLTAVPTGAQVGDFVRRLCAPFQRGVAVAHPFELGTAHAPASDAVPTGDGAETVKLVADVGCLWDSITHDGGVPAPESNGQLSQLITNIATSVSGSRASVLRLAAIKDMDEYTFVHTVNVAIQAAALAEAVGLSRPNVHAVIEAGLLHDIGKANIPSSILNKKGLLTDGERLIVQNHSVDGAAMLLERSHPNPIAVLVAYEHHMHIDGTGYPAPRRHERPHLASQIVQVADVFDALRTHRPYRAALPHEVAVETMWKSAGAKFDTDLLTTFFDRVATRSPVPQAA